MHIHILGICGTFMGGIALLARQRGYQVSGSDANVYPPMSTQLERAGIPVLQGYSPAHLDPAPDVVLVGNALSRGNPAVEALLDRRLPYISGPQWLAEQLLARCWVLAVAGTHGKTTTSAMLAWILECAGLSPGFLIGGVPENFGVSARVGGESFFVVEADEYDTAFFDKRSKFLHYRPRTLTLNNLEYDHADIFPDLEAIKRQFHHLVRTVPSNGLIVMPADDANLAQVLKMGCWTPVQTYGEQQGTWTVREIASDGSQFTICFNKAYQGRLRWTLMGRHNVANALVAIAAAHHAGVPVDISISALEKFRGVKRRMEVRGRVNGVTVYDDFAHHPTAIAVTLEGLRHKVGQTRILVILEPRSNTMRLGIHQGHLAAALMWADRALLYQPKDIAWDLTQVAADAVVPTGVYTEIDSLVHAAVEWARPGDHMVIMSNGGFGGIHDKLLQALNQITVSVSEV